MDFASALVPLLCTNICAKENDDENDVEACIRNQLQCGHNDHSDDDENSELILKVIIDDSDDINNLEHCKSAKLGHTSHQGHQGQSLSICIELSKRKTMYKWPDSI